MISALEVGGKPDLAHTLAVWQCLTLAWIPLCKQQCRRRRCRRTRRGHGPVVVPGGRCRRRSREGRRRPPEPLPADLLVGGPVTLLAGGAAVAGFL